VSYSQYYPEICLEELKKTEAIFQHLPGASEKNQRQDNWFMD
jgi:hypothetical protein